MEYTLLSDPETKLSNTKIESQKVRYSNVAHIANQKRGKGKEGKGREVMDIESEGQYVLDNYDDRDKITRMIRHTSYHNSNNI